MDLGAAEAGTYHAVELDIECITKKKMIKDGKRHCQADGKTLFFLPARKLTLKEGSSLNHGGEAATYHTDHG